MEQLDYKEENRTPVKKVLECNFDTELSPMELKNEVKEQMLDDIAFEHITLSHDFDSVLDFCDEEKTKDILSSSLFDSIGDSNVTDETLMMENPLKIEQTEEETNSRTRRCVPLRKYSPMKKEESDAESDEEISLNDRAKLQKLCIKLIHSVPPQHKVESTAGTHGPTQEQKQLFEVFGPIKIGKFSINEDEILIRNWRKFCKIHDWDPKNVKPFLKMRHTDGQYLISTLHERKKFVQFLGNGLLWRTLHSIYGRFKNIHMKYKHKKYSKEEDEKIISFLKQKRSNATNSSIIELEKILNRSKSSINRRNRKLKSVTVPKKKISLVNFELSESVLIKYIKTLLEVTGSDDIQDLKDIPIPKVIWEKMASIQKMDEGILKKFWFHQLHMQLFSPRPIYFNDIRILLIEYMYGKGISNRRDIIWANVVRSFEGMTAPFLNVVFTRLVGKVESMIGTQASFIKIVEFLHEHTINQVATAEEDQFLPRLSYVDGAIEILDQ